MCLQNFNIHSQHPWFITFTLHPVWPLWFSTCSSNSPSHHFLSHYLILFPYCLRYSPSPPLSCLYLIITYCVLPQRPQFIKQDSGCHDHHRLILLTEWLAGWLRDWMLFWLSCRDSFFLPLPLFLISFLSKSVSVNQLCVQSVCWCAGVCVCACWLLCALRVQGLHVIL